MFRKESKTKEQTYHPLWGQFYLGITVVILVSILSALLFMFYHNQTLREQIHAQARAHAQNIILTRRWNSMHGGVYVEKKGNVVSNPYLKNPDITAVDGKVYTLKNATLMTREISELADSENLFSYRITSLKPINPGNAPDPFESRALERFAQLRGEKEYFETQTKDGRRYSRYIVPLYVEQNCITCHAAQGYAVGDVRGGISISLDAMRFESTLAENKNLVPVFGVLLVGSALSLAYGFILRFMRRLQGVLRKLQDLTVTDELTGLCNRRHLFERLEEEAARSHRHNMPLGCIMLDLDHFKAVNDKYGHQAGDAVLRDTAAILKKFIRQSDLAARYGGEEFILLLPGTGLNDTRTMAVRVRAALRDAVFELPGGGALKVTASIGCSALMSTRGRGATDITHFLMYIDELLYKAKGNGRDRIEWAKYSAQET